MISDWFQANKLTVNLEKTCFIIFKSKHKQIPEYLNSIQIGNAIIKKVPSAKYLGVVLDEKLNWKEHISTLNKSLLKVSNSFKNYQAQSSSNRQNHSLQCLHLFQNLIWN